LHQLKKIEMAENNFVDYVKIFCRSGNGGPGSKHMRREKSEPHGGPDGGDGGRGGHVILRGNAQMWTLLHLKFRKHIFAGHGESGGRQCSTGADGEDIIIEVPLGTVAKDSETGDFLFEITNDGESQIIKKGGRGGQGNTHFKSPTNQAPRFAQPGEDGLEGWCILELKILADVGLVGFPNAGKSTLLSVVSAAKPKIADYPFTTLTPNLGIVGYRDNRSFVMADIPGIIEGAHLGKGLGIRFLRHIERNSMLLFLVPADSKNHLEEYNILLNELEKYNPEMLDKQRFLAVSKSDFLDEDLMQEISNELGSIPHMFISSVTGKNVDRLKDRVWSLLNE
jgi:GTPase